MLTKNLGMHAFIDSISSGDPLGNLANVGHRIILAGEGILIVYLKLFTATTTVDKVANSSIVGKVTKLFSAGLVHSVISAGTDVLSKIWPLVILASIPMLTLGVMLAIYLPAVPYIIWMSAIIGGIILWLEFLVHVSIWSITFATGEGEGLTGQRSQQGLLLIANALLRLPLMVVGYMMAMVIMPEIGNLIGSTLKVVVAGMTADHIVGFVTMIGTWFLFGGFTILETHTVYGLVTHLPDGAMKFFGGAMSSMGEAAHEGKTRAMAMAILGKGEGIGNQGIAKSPPVAGTQNSEHNSKQSEGGAQTRSQTSKDMDLGSRSD